MWNLTSQLDHLVAGVVRVKAEREFVIFVNSHVQSNFFLKLFHLNSYSINSALAGSSVELMEWNVLIPLYLPGLACGADICLSLAIVPCFIPQSCEKKT